ncbi:UNVERIFIED_CONTAM: hypothetical protein RMT77_019703 [Armadillidium vulgare]
MAISRRQYVENLHLDYYGPQEIDVNSLYLNYDLKTNYLHHDEIEVKSLQELCILTAVVKAFECDEAVKEIRQISNDEHADNLFAVVENKLPMKELPPKFVKEIKLEIRLVFKEIYRFLESIFWEDKFAFLGNFEFNWQGAINPRKTVLKVLNCSQLTRQEKFEFSCKYLFDEEIIRMYFNDLGETQNYYTNPNNFVGLFGYLNYYWVSRIQGQLQRPPAYLPQIGNHELVSSTFFIQYIKSPYCAEIGVQFLFENLAPSESVVKQVIKNLFEINSLKYHAINVSMYLLCKIQNYRMFRKYSDAILIKLIKNPRWHDIFIRYFKILRFQICHDLKLFKIVIKELMSIIKLEGTGGKYYFILKDFIKLIPSISKTIMRENDEYALLVFSLFVYKDIETIKPLFYSHPISNLNVWDAFYEFVSKYSNKLLFRDYFPSVVEEFIRETLESEDKISELLTKLKIE